MKESKNRFLAFSFGDYEGVRACLDALAAEGWELTGRSGWLTGRFVPTRRTELRYDVVPADPRRGQEAMEAEVETRRGLGWEPVDTVWGMDIYKSLPCQLPELPRSEADCRKFRRVFLHWLIWSAAFLAVTAAALFFVGDRTGMNREQLAYRWYLSDSKTVLCIALPFLGGMAVLWLVWLIFCLLRRSKIHRPSHQGMLYLRGGLQVLVIAVTALLPVTLWLNAIPRAWLRLVLLICFYLSPLLSGFIGRENGRKRLLTLGSGVFACFLAAMILGWTVQPVRYDTALQGSSCRAEDSSLPVLRAEDLEPDSERQEVSAWYEEGGSLLVKEQHYTELWDDGYIDVQVYTCHVPLLADTLMDDFTVQNGESQLLFREGNRIYSVSGMADWSDRAVRQAAQSVLVK